MLYVCYVEGGAVDDLVEFDGGRAVGVEWVCCSPAGRVERDNFSLVRAMLQLFTEVSKVHKVLRYRKRQYGYRVSTLYTIRS